MAQGWLEEGKAMGRVKRPKVLRGINRKQTNKQKNWLEDLAGFTGIVRTMKMLRVTAFNK